MKGRKNKGSIEPAPFLYAFCDIWGARITSQPYGQKKTVFYFSKKTNKVASFSINLKKNIPLFGMNKTFGSPKAKPCPMQGLKSPPAQGVQKKATTALQCLCSLNSTQFLSQVCPDSHNTSWTPAGCFLSFLGLSSRQIAISGPQYLYSGLKAGFHSKSTQK